MERPNYVTPARTQYQRSLIIRDAFCQWSQAQSMLLGGCAKFEPTNSMGNTINMVDKANGDITQLRLVNQHAALHTGNTAWEIGLMMADGSMADGWLDGCQADWLVVGYGEPLDFHQYRIIQPSDLLAMLFGKDYPVRQNKFHTKERQREAKNRAIGATNVLMPVEDFIKISGQYVTLLTPTF